MLRTEIFEVGDNFDFFAVILREVVVPKNGDFRERFKNLHFCLLLEKHRDCIV